MNLDDSPHEICFQKILISKVAEYGQMKALGEKSPNAFELQVQLPKFGIF